MRKMLRAACSRFDTFCARTYSASTRVDARDRGEMVTGGSHSSGVESAQQLQRLLAARDYIADDALSVSLFLACKLGRPLLLEGAPGVGKTELAKVMSLVLGTDLIRLQ